MVPHCLTSEKDLAQDFSCREIPHQAHLAGHAKLAILRASDLARDAHRRPGSMTTTCGMNNHVGGGTNNHVGVVYKLDDLQSSDMLASTVSLTQLAPLAR